jgi:ATP-binding cassette subfamily B multidrug efflux pump
MHSPQEDAALIKNPLLFYIRKQKLWFGLGLLFLFLTNLLDGLHPLLLKRGIDQITAKAPLSELLTTCIYYFLMILAIAGTRFCWRTFFGRYHTAAAEDLRNRFFNHLTKLGPSFYQKNPIGELMSLMTNDVQSFRMAIGSGIIVLFDAISITLILLPVMIMLNPAWTWKTLIFLPLVPLLIWKVHKVIFERYKVQQDRLSELSGISQEIAAGIRVIKGFAQEKGQLNHYNKKSKELENTSNHVAIVDALFMPIMQFGVASGTVILLFIAADDILTGAATVGTLVAFQRYINKMVWPMTALGMGISQFQKGMASFSRIANVLKQPTDIPNQGEELISKFTSLAVRNLSFTYAGQSAAILKDISFEIKKGQTFGIVGPVGSGKTTLLHLLTRLYPVPENQIQINGISIEKIEQSNLRKNLVMVPQEAFLFSTSIMNNVAFGLNAQNFEATVENIEPWTNLTDITNEIRSLPDQFNSQLGERGVNLSGGQKQRLTIARGLIMAAPVLILDDSLSAVDTKTEERIQKFVLTNSPEQTKIIVTHRLSTVRHADQILVLNGGTVEAIGSHVELLERSPTYRKMHAIQMEKTHEVQA